MKERKPTNLEIAKALPEDQLKEIVLAVNAICQEIYVAIAPKDIELKALEILVKESDLTIRVPSYKKDKGSLPRKMLELNTYMGRLLFKVKMSKTNGGEKERA